MPEQRFRKGFSRIEQGTFNALYCLQEPVMPDRQPAMRNEDEDTLHQISADLGKGYTRQAAVPDSEIKVYIANWLARKCDKTVWHLNCEMLAKATKPGVGTLLARLFADAELHSPILLFDAADCLFDGTLAPEDTDSLLNLALGFHGLCLFVFRDPALHQANRHRFTSSFIR